MGGVGSGGSAKGAVKMREWYANHNNTRNIDDIAREYNAAHPDETCSEFGIRLIEALAMHRPKHLSICRLRRYEGT